MLHMSSTDLLLDRPEVKFVLAVQNDRDVQGHSKSRTYLSKNIKLEIRLAGRLYII